MGRVSELQCTGGCTRIHTVVESGPQNVMITLLRAEKTARSSERGF
jgi:hypothetical protein